MASLRTSLGRTIRTLRENAGFSQEGFADAIGLHRTYMGTLERGKANPTLETLELVAKGLKTSVLELIRAADSGRSDTRAEYPRPKRGRPLGRVADRTDDRR